MWSAGVVAYMLVSGGVSPFYSGWYSSSEFIRVNLNE